VEGRALAFLLDGMLTVRLDGVTGELVNEDLDGKAAL